jgi:hypothetical protein
VRAGLRAYVAVLCCVVFPRPKRKTIGEKNNKLLNLVSDEFKALMPEVLDMLDVILKPGCDLSDGQAEQIADVLHDRISEFCQKLCGVSLRKLRDSALGSIFHGFHFLPQEKIVQAALGKFVLGIQDVIGGIRLTRPDEHDLLLKHFVRRWVLVLDRASRTKCFQYAIQYGSIGDLLSRFGNDKLSDQDKLLSQINYESYVGSIEDDVKESIWTNFFSRVSTQFIEPMLEGNMTIIFDREDKCSEFGIPFENPVTIVHGLRSAAGIGRMLSTVAAANVSKWMTAIQEQIGYAQARCTNVNYQQLDWVDFVRVMMALYPVETLIKIKDDTQFECDYCHEIRVLIVVLCSFFKIFAGFDLWVRCNLSDDEVAVIDGLMSSICGLFVSDPGLKDEAWVQKLEPQFQGLYNFYRGSVLDQMICRMQLLVKFGSGDDAANMQLICQVLDQCSSGMRSSPGFSDFFNVAINFVHDDANRTKLRRLQDQSKKRPAVAAGIEDDNSSPPQKLTRKNAVVVEMDDDSDAETELELESDPLIFDEHWFEN